jgi:hypothetical protein
MELKIDKLKNIILNNTELSDYSTSIELEWSEVQIDNFIKKILSDFEHYAENSNRPIFYTELQVLLNKYGPDNKYTKPEMLD